MDVSGNLPTSGVMGEDVIFVYHSQMDIGTYYQYECGKTFLEVCVEMGLDKSDTEISF